MSNQGSRRYFLSAALSEVEPLFSDVEDASFFELSVLLSEEELAADPLPLLDDFLA